MSLLSPASIAVIGASAQEGKVGHDILKNLLTQGYTGDVFPVNPKGGEILGKNVYASVKDIPNVPDLAVIVIPAAAVPGALEECGQKGIKNVVIISAGFSEVHTEEGHTLEEQLRMIADKYKITLIGPNCLGIVRSDIKMNASFAKNLPHRGNIAVVSQSGAMGVALMDGAHKFGLGLSTFISIGNKAMTDECDMLELLADDKETHVIGFYLESVKDGRRFLEATARVAQKKPIVLLKAGVSDKGRSAASSHTGALAGSDSAIDALCIQTGIHRARSTEEFLDMLCVLSLEPQLLTNRIAIVTNAGGPGILATDAAALCGLAMPSLSPAVEKKLRISLPAASSTANPIDLIGDAGADRYTTAFATCQDDKNIDGIVVLLTPQVMTPCEEIAQTIVKLHKTSPLMPVVCAFMGGNSVDEAKTILRSAGIPCFATPERAVRALAALRAPGKKHVPQRLALSANATAQSIMSDKQGLLDEASTAKLFALYDLPLPKQSLAHSPDEAVKIAQSIGYPVIAKISASDILHKTDIGGIRANLKSDEEVKAAYNEIIRNSSLVSRASSLAVLIQQFLPVGNEFIVGAVRDPSFGPLIMAGLGGIYTELFKDTSFRIAPVSQEEAYMMLQDLKAWKLLLGMRGKPQSDIDALAETVEKVSRLMLECPQIQELDLNPVLVSDKGVLIADAKVILED
jgi:acetate---CoA ligase (ADP-forming)